MNGRFFKSIAILSTGNLLAQAIHLVTYIVLPRFYYSPGEFGLFGFYLALYFIFFEIVNLKMDQAIMLPAEKREARELLGLAWLLAGVVSTALFFILLSVAQVTDRITGPTAFFLGAGLLAGGLMQPAMVWLNRKRRYVAMGGVRVVQALTTLGASIAAWHLFRDSLNGLIAGFVAGLSAAAVLALFLAGPVSISLPDRATINRYSQFLRYGSASSLISTLSRNLPVFMIRPVFGESALGWYTLAVKYLNAPVGLLTAAVGQVYYRDASRAGAQDLRRLTRSVIGYILLLALVPVVALLFTAPALVEWVFGEAWRPAGQVVRVLVLWYYVAYASGPVSMLLDVKLKLRWELTYNILLLAGRALALATVFWWKDFFGILGLYALVGLLFNIWLLIYVMRLSGRHD